ncbi:MAG: hypothetical protein IT378_06585, partial [Sandaracinaceae bacterium]|nr:hypothetical protein [Sandaracinaceae bacterium]
MRRFLDEALVALRSIADPGVAREEVEGALTRAAQRVYAASARQSEWGIVRAECDEARRELGGALFALQRVDTSDPGAARVTESVARTLGHLSQVGLDLEDAIRLPRED